MKLLKTMRSVKTRGNNKGLPTLANDNSRPPKDATTAPILYKLAVKDKEVGIFSFFPFIHGN